MREPIVLDHAGGHRLGGAALVRDRRPGIITTAIDTASRRSTLPDVNREKVSRTARAKTVEPSASAFGPGQRQNHTASESRAGSPRNG